MKQLNKWLLPFLSMGMTFAVAAWAAQETPSTQPSDSAGTTSKTDKDKKATGTSSRWGYAPYNKLTGMTDEQKMKISDIHRKFLADRKALEDKQEADVMAVLTDEQKAELDKLAAEKKAKDAEKRATNKKDKGAGGGGDDEKDK